jgi:spore germination cell wall hydrolase CwlJ-like protein
MTDTALDNKDTLNVSLPIANILKLIFMSLALILAGCLLKWTIDDKLSKYEPEETNQVTAAIRERQLNCLAKNIYYEAGTEPFEGKVAIAQVTLNRVSSGLFPSDICKTIYQKNIIYEKVICQFSWACDRDTGVRPPNNSNYRESMEVAKKVLLEGFRLPSLDKAMYFHGDYINPGWKREKITKIGHHIFYK